MEKKFSQNAKAVREFWPESDALRMGIGWSEEDLEKPYILIEDVMGDTHPGAIHTGTLSSQVRDGVLEAGGRPANFHVTDICDGNAQAHDGMNYILISREVIADAIQVHGSVHPWDGLVLISSCDKSNPGQLKAAARLDLPTVFVPGGTMRPSPYMSSCGRGGELSLQMKHGSVSEQEVMDFIRTGCPSCGACNFMGTASTMQCMAEALGLALPGSAICPATMLDIQRLARQAGHAVLELKRRGITARDILTPAAFRNAIVVHAGLGGSPNALIHLPAVAHELDIELDPDLFDEINRKVPYITNVNPSGEHCTEAFWFAGGVPRVMEALKEYLDLDVLTVTGKTLGENLAELRESGFFERGKGYLANYGLRPEQVILPKEEWKEIGSVAVLHGNIGPEGAVIKYSAVSKDMLRHVGPARVFDCEEDCAAAVVDGSAQPGDVLVIRYEGPRGSGMPELFMTSEAIMSDGRLGSSTVILSDGRYAGAGRGPCIGHVSPEAAAGGPIALLEDGDLIEMDIPARKLNVVGIRGERCSEERVQEVLEERRKNWTRPPLRDVRKGIYKRYTERAVSAMKGAYLE